MAMTKEQFIKRIEEITGYKYEKSVLEDSIHNTKYLFFIKETSETWWYIETSITFGKLKIKFNYEEWDGFNSVWKKHPFNMPIEWLIPLGEAIKEYYD